MGDRMISNHYHCTCTHTLYALSIKDVGQDLETMLHSDRFGLAYDTHTHTHTHTHTPWILNLEPWKKTIYGWCPSATKWQTEQKFDCDWLGWGRILPRGRVITHLCLAMSCLLKDLGYVSHVKLTLLSPPCLAVLWIAVDERRLALSASTHLVVHASSPFLHFNLQRPLSCAAQNQLLSMMLRFCKSFFTRCLHLILGPCAGWCCGSHPKRNFFGKWSSSILARWPNQRSLLADTKSSSDSSIPNICLTCTLLMCSVHGQDVDMPKMDLRHLL